LRKNRLNPKTCCSRRHVRHPYRVSMKHWPRGNSMSDINENNGLADKNPDFDFQILLISEEIEDSQFLISLLPDPNQHLIPCRKIEEVDCLLDDNDFNIIIIDQNFKHQGYDLCKKIKSNPDWEHIPVLILTSVIGIKERKKIQNCKGDDFLQKPIRKDEFLLRIRSLIRLSKLNETLSQKVRELEMAKSDLEQLAITDGTTGLYNYRFFKIQLAREMLRGKRYKQPVSLLMIDIDNFKQINDQHGHPVGNQTLYALSDLMVKHVRSVDLVARYGGEEFGIVLPSTRKSDALVVAEKIRQLVERTAFQKGLVKFTISIGVSAFPEDGRDEEQLVYRADQALLRAKQSGKNRIAAS